MLRVIGVGDNVVDKYLDKRMMYPGGNALNFSVYASKLGFASAYLGVFGDDEAARLIQSTLDEFGVDHGRCRTERGENGFSCVNIVEGDRKFVVGNNGGVLREHPLMLEAEDLSYLSQFDLMHTSCYSFIEQQLPLMRDLPGLVSFDFSRMTDDNYLKAICPYVDFALMSCGGMEERAIKDKMHTVYHLGSPYVLATMGAQGTMFYDGTDNQYYYQPARSGPVVDTLGAGDSLFTAFATSYFQGKKQQGSVSQAFVAQCLAQAADFATETCQLNGAFGHGMSYDTNREV